MLFGEENGAFACRCEFVQRGLSNEMPNELRRWSLFMLHALSSNWIQQKCHILVFVIMLHFFILKIRTIYMEICETMFSQQRITWNLAYASTSGWFVVECRQASEHTNNTYWAMQQRLKMPPWTEQCKRFSSEKIESLAQQWQQNAYLKRYHM